MVHGDNPIQLAEHLRLTAGFDLLQLTQHCEALQKKIENLEEVFTTGGAQEHGHTTKLPVRPMTGSDWGLLGTNDASAPSSANTSLRAGPRRGQTVADDAADALLQQAGTY